MACAYSNCNHCFCDQDCVAHTPACPSNAYSFTDPTLSTSYDVKTYHMNQLRTAINQERVRRGLGNYSFGSDVTTTYTVYGSHFNDLKTALNQIWNIIGDTYTTSLNITYSKVATLRTRINQLKIDCICNSNCDNYSACVCYGNCGCNYSDEELKEEIKYF